MSDKKRTCFTCSHKFVCHLLYVVRQANEIDNVPPYTTRFLATAQNIGSDCQHHLFIESEGR